jgi:hypothetical protein
MITVRALTKVYVAYMLDGMLRLALALLATPFVAFALLVAWWWLRPNQARVDARLEPSWTLVSDGRHNSNTDLVRFGGAWLLVHATSPYHMGTPESRLVVRRCDDAEPRPGSRWEKIAELGAPGLDIRDPIFAEIGGRLFLYALTNPGFYAAPSATVLATSDDGAAWSAFEPVGPPGWLFWRMRAHPSERSPGGGPVWYASAYWKDHGESILLRSPDGRAFERLATIHRGDANDETEIAFLPRADGSLSDRLVATCRLEITPDNLVGHSAAATLLAFADPPYTDWSRERTVRTQATRLDGPVAFADGGRLFFVARAQPGPRHWPFRLGSAFARKRTALWSLDPGREEPEGKRAGAPRLLWLSDLPSAGDTAYAGVGLANGALYTDYYTSRIDRDYAWLLGMILPTEIRMIRVPLADLHRMADAAR